jgi:hypothetical protein
VAVELGAAVAVVALAGAGIGWGLTEGSSTPDRPASGPSAQRAVDRPAEQMRTTSPAGVVRRTPKSPPAQVCGSASLRGPAKKPKGAVKVSGRLDVAVATHRAGTTFWLTPGVHKLGTGEFDQVQPKQGDVIVGAPGAVLDGGHVNHYAFGGHAAKVTISHLTVQNFGTSVTDDFNEGVVNHDAGHHWRMLHLTVRDNAGAGVFLGSGDAVKHSCLVDNGQYGFSAYEDAGVSGVRLIGNEIARNDTADWETRQSGCGCTGGGKFWATRNAVVRGNWVHDNPSVGIWADTDNTGFLFEGNYLSGNADAGIVYETSYNARIVHNTFVRNALIGGPADPGFPHAALYLSESGSDPRAGARYGASFVVAHNRFRDNWSGVVLWENADRFAGSPANSSTGITTLVNPAATVAACGTASKVAQKPLYDDCRWKTQRVQVTHNVFRFSTAKVGHGCARTTGCGYVGVFSNYGSYPSWSPYQGTVVEQHITFDQGNRFADNSYRGPWRFLGLDQAHVLTWKQWRGAPYHQDRGSHRGR